MAPATQLPSASSSSSSSSFPAQVTTVPTPEARQAQFELGVALALSLWPALTLAVQNQWGGPSSSDKRDWFAGAIVDLFDSRPDTDLEDVETVLLQVMLDEFEVNVDDDSGFEVAEQVMRLRRDCDGGNFGEVELLRERWERLGKGAKEVRFKRVENGEDDDDDTDWDSDDLEEAEDKDEDGDVEMGDAPAVREKEKVGPEVDEDGFTKVANKKKR